jgi:hypothetical protein
MKLTIEKHPEFVQLAHYFKKIEALAEKMGIDVDDLIQERRNKNFSMYTSFKKSVLAMAHKRVEALINRSKGSSSGETSIVGLTILLNKENKN